MKPEIMLSDGQIEDETGFYRRFFDYPEIGRGTIDLGHLSNRIKTARIAFEEPYGHSHAYIVLAGPREDGSPLWYDIEEERCALFFLHGAARYIRDKQ